jgi:hypothetical protein
LNRDYCWIPAKFPENPMRKELEMKRRLESPTRRENPAEERQNRPGREFGGGGGGLKKCGALGSVDRRPRALIRSAWGPGDPARVAGRPGDHQRRSGRPGHLCRSTRRGPRV